MQETPECRPLAVPVSGSSRATGIVFAFNIFGWIGTIAGFIMLVSAAIYRDPFMMVPAVTLFIGGLLYLAVAAIVRSTAETAWNTAQLLLCARRKEE